MARIPDDELERLKQDLSLERLAEARGIVLKRHGADLLGLCPFHDDHEPSLVISPNKTLWHCLEKGGQYPFLLRGFCTHSANGLP